MSVELSSKDLKNPKSFLKKFFKGLLNGAGGVGQDLISSNLKPMIPNAPVELVAGIQWIVSALASGAITNEYFESVLAGVSGGSAKELFSSLINRIGNKVMPKKSANTQQTYYQPPINNEPF